MFCKSFWMCEKISKCQRMSKMFKISKMSKMSKNPIHQFRVHGLLLLKYWFTKFESTDLQYNSDQLLYDKTLYSKGGCSKINCFLLAKKFTWVNSIDVDLKFNFF